MPDAIPERLKRGGRPIDPDFAPTEPLYRSYDDDDIEGDRFVPDRISFRDWSVNRGKYSEPQDVLIGRPRDGIATFFAGDVPARLVSTGGVAFDFKCEHDPEDDNYSHSRLIAGRDGTFDRALDVSKLVKKEFRAILSDQIQLPPEWRPKS